MLIHGYDLLQYLFCTVNFFEPWLQTKKEENKTKACWLECLMPSCCTTSSHTTRAPEAIKVVFVWLNTSPFELGGGSFPLALSCNCVQPFLFFFSGLIWNPKCLQVGPLYLLHPFLKAKNVCYCNICYIPYPEAQTGRTKHSSLFLHKHAHTNPFFF